MKKEEEEKRRKRKICFLKKRIASCIKCTLYLGCHRHGDVPIASPHIDHCVGQQLHPVVEEIFPAANGQKEDSTGEYHGETVTSGHSRSTGEGRAKSDMNEVLIYYQTRQFSS